MEANTATREGAQASIGPTNFREHQIWLRLLNRSCLPPAARCVGFAIAGHRNMKTGRCDPSHARLSAETGFPQRSVERYIAALRRTGFLVVVRGGRGHPSRYRLLWPCPATQVADQVPPHDPPVSAAPDDMTRHMGGRQTENSPTEDPKGSSYVGDGDKERADAREDSTWGPDDAPEGASGRRREDQDAPCAAEWRELHDDIWRRGHLKDDTPQQRAIDRAAFANARKIATVDTILAGARAWYAAFAAADGPYYLPELHVWLAQRGWAKPPSAQPQKLRGARAPRATTAGGTIGNALLAMRGRL